MNLNVLRSAIADPLVPLVLALDLSYRFVFYPITRN